MLFLGYTAFHDITLYIYVQENGLYQVEEYVLEDLAHTQQDLTKDRLSSLYRAFDLETLDWDRAEMAPRMAS